MGGNTPVETAGPFLDRCYTWHRFMNTFQYIIFIVYYSEAAVVNCGSVSQSSLCTTASHAVVKYQSRLCVAHLTAGGDTALC